MALLLLHLNNSIVSFDYINTKKAFKKLYMFYFETFRIILNPSSVKKNKATLGNTSNSKPKNSVTQELTV